MGLDNYAASVKPPQDWTDADEDLYLAPEADAALRSAQAEIEQRHEICVFEGPYFRGKLYFEIIEHITGVYINEAWLPPETVRMMAEKLARCDPAETCLRELKGSGGWEPCTPDDLSDLIVFFRVCAEHGLGLVAGYREVRGERPGPSTSGAYHDFSSPFDVPSAGSSLG